VMTQNFVTAKSFVGRWEALRAALLLGERKTTKSYMPRRFVTAGELAKRHSNTTLLILTTVVNNYYE